MVEENKNKGKVPSEIGNTGLIQPFSITLGEIRRDLSFPLSVNTFDKMSQNVAIASALNAVNIVASRVPIFVEPYSQTDVHKKRAKFLEECLLGSDMEHTFYDFLRWALTFNKYGFSVIEKVFRYRNKSEGSKFDDGKIGIKKLPIRSQHSIINFKYDDEHRNFLGVWQTSQKYIRNTSLSRINLEGNTFIPKDRILLFKADTSTGNPEGVSPLAGCYTAWRELCKLQDYENIAAQKNLNGVPVLSLPAEYMSEEATDEEKKVYDVAKKSITKIGIGEQSSIVLPSNRDDLGNKYWSLEIASASASNVTSISQIVQRKTNEIYQCLFADILQMGNERGGNGNLADNKASLLNMMVETRMKEIFDVINTDLIPDLFARNGWDETKLPQLKFGKLSNIDMAVFAKAMQQLKATKLVAVTPENINFIAEVMQLPFRIPLDITQEELDKILQVEANDQSRSGDSLNTGSGGQNGTSDNVSESDNSADNLNNV